MGLRPVAATNRRANVRGRSPASIAIAETGLATA